MENLVNQFKSTALGVADFLTPVLKESKFRETGVLTPEEFLVAGDHLVHHCPTWQWARASDESRTRSFLPPDKQFLITRNVPCHKRCRHMEYDDAQMKILSGTEAGADGEEGWVDTHHFAPTQKATQIDAPQVSSAADDEDEEEGEAVDMAAFAEGLEEDDPHRFVEKPKESEALGAEVEHPRTYDLHITYDKYYQVPRLWLGGYDENRKPLTNEEMNEDFSQDHANKTITMETHPHLDCPSMASIHPCRHAETMKRIMEQLADNGKELGVHQYLLIFLKFVQAVIPTIEYDFTRGVQL